MINTKVTLQNLHERFSDLGLDDLFAILECIVEEPCITWANYSPDRIYCDTH